MPKIFLKIILIAGILFALFPRVSLAATCSDYTPDKCPGSACSSDQICVTKNKNLDGSETCKCAAATSPATPTSGSGDNGMLKLTMPDLQITIPGLNFSKPDKCSDDTTKLCVNWIGEYIAGIYNYAIGIVGIVATVVLMYGGIIWLTAAGNAPQIKEAQAWITASITGLIIALSSYMILYYINPNLVSSVGKPLEISLVDRAPAYLLNSTDYTAGSGSGDTSYNGTTYDALIKQIAVRKGVDPALVKAVMAAESQGNPRATSPVGAQGLMQLMPSTARGMGVTDAYNPTQNLTAGTVFIRDLMNKYSNDMPRALAAYNWGPGNVDRKGMGSLPVETQRYIATVTSYYNRFKGTL